jgi:hypothetical protein
MAELDSYPDPVRQSLEELQRELERKNVEWRPTERASRRIVKPKSAVVRVGQVVAVTAIIAGVLARFALFLITCAMIVGFLAEKLWSLLSGWLGHPLYGRRVKKTAEASSEQSVYGLDKAL